MFSSLAKCAIFKVVFQAKSVNYLPCVLSSGVWGCVRVCVCVCVGGGGCVGVGVCVCVCVVSERGIRRTWNNSF